MLTRWPKLGDGSNLAEEEIANDVVDVTEANEVENEDDMMRLTW